MLFNVFRTAILCTSFVVLFGPTIVFPTLQEFLGGDATPFILLLLLVCLTFYYNFDLYCGKKNSEPAQEAEARLHAKMALIGFLLFLLSIVISLKFTRVLNFTAFIYVFLSGLGAYRFTRRRDRLQYFRKLRYIDLTLPSLFSAPNGKILVLNNEYTLEGLRAVLRDYNDFSEDTLTEIVNILDKSKK